MRWSLHFVACVFFFQAIIVTSVKSLGHSPVSCMVLIRKFLRHLLGITKLDKEKNQCIREKTGAQTIVKEIK